MGLRTTALTARAARLSIVVLAVLLCAYLVNVASAGSGCAQQIIEDWSDNGVIDGTYSPDCYQQAIAALPEDLRSYSSAADDINRALQQALLGGVEAGGGGVTGGVTGGDPSSSGGSQGNGEAGGDEPSEGAGTATAEEPGATTDASTLSPSDEDEAGTPSAAGVPAGDDGTGLPPPVIALIVLAGVAAAVALIVAGRRVARGRSDTRT
jgi:hypothetical protein